MGIKTGAGGMGIMGRDIEQARGTLGRQAAELAKAKSGGAGIGGLLGAIVGQILIPIPGVGAAIGGALGGLAGSKIGGATSGVDQSDLMGGKFFKKSGIEMAEQIAKKEMGDVVKAGVSGYMMAGTIGGGLEAMKGGATAAGKAGTSTIMGGLKGLGEFMAPQFAKEGMGDAAAKGVSVSGKSMGMNLKDLYGGADKFLGGVLPGGEKLSRGSLGQAFGGLLGPKVTGSDTYGGGDAGVSEEVNFGNIQETIQSAIPELSGLPSNSPFSSPDEVSQFQQQFNSMGWGSISEDGQWGPETEKAWKIFQGMGG